MQDELRAETPQEEGCMVCQVCGEIIPACDWEDHIEEHEELDSLERTRPLPRDPVVRAFWEGWKGNVT